MSPAGLPEGHDQAVPPATAGEHPFAAYVRILGKGKTGTRSLSFEEARKAFSMILRGEVEPLQLGAFLMLLRVKEETAEELAGFVAGCRETMATTPAAVADLDWSSYAGKRAQHPWFLLSALLLAENGVRVLLHGAEGHTPGRAYTRQTLAQLGVPSSRSISEATAEIEQSGFAFVPLGAFCQPLEDIIQLKPLLGLRSPVNTLARMLNPLAADYSIQSVFHPNYAALHTGADQILGQANSLVFKGDGGEVEIKPQANTTCHLLRGKQTTELIWPRRLEHRPTPVNAPDGKALRDLWRGVTRNAYGELAVVETCAVALLLLQRADSISGAQALAKTYWDQRERSRF